jgi:eukaryotic-like serine/threonine-protein kinase
MRDLVGVLIAQRYRLISRLGSGGMGDVYLARHVLIERLGAIKLLRPTLGQDEAARDRFLREARAVNRLNHRNIVEITDYGESDGLVYLVMEYVPGEPLSRHLERGPLGWRRAAKIGLQVASALGRAHEMDVIHRDLKPANLLLVARRGGEDLVKLTDFGMAKLTDVASITSSTVALGTPGYVAPEYAEYGSVYEATAGHLPFPAANPSDRGDDPPPPPPLSKLAPETPEFFDAVIRTLLARDPDDRPRDGFEAHDLLRRALEGNGERIVISSLDGTAARTGGSESSAAEPHDAPSQPAPRRAAPHLTTTPFDKIAPLCAAALARVDAALAQHPAPTHGAQAAASGARRLVAMVHGISALLVEDSEAIEATVERGRRIRADLGRQLDEVGREHSRSLGWAGTLAERGDVVRARRDSGEHPVPVVEAMVWEQAALEQEEERARDGAAEQAARMQTLHGDLARQNERLEHDMLVAGARLEGHVAALRSIALEAWMALEDAAERTGTSLVAELAAAL